MYGTTTSSSASMSPISWPNPPSTVAVSGSPVDIVVHRRDAKCSQISRTRTSIHSPRKIHYGFLSNTTTIPPRMSILKRFSLISDLAFAFYLAFWPTLTRVSATPSLLFNPTEISRIFMSHVWTAFGAGIDGNSAKIKTSLITQNAYGVVLDLGAGKPSFSLGTAPVHSTSRTRPHGQIP